MARLAIQTLPADNKKGGPREAAFLIRFTVHKTENPSRPWERAMLEVILQNPCGQRGGQGCSVVLDRADDFATADDFRGGESGNFLREH